MLRDEQIAAIRKQKKAKVPYKPTVVNLSKDEREILEKIADGRTLAGAIRSLIRGENARIMTYVQRDQNPDPCTRVPMPLLLDASISPTAKVVFGYLSSCQRGRNPEVKVPQTTIGVQLGFGRNTVSRAVMELKRAGHLKIIKSGDVGEDGSRRDKRVYLLQYEVYGWTNPDHIVPLSSPEPPRFYKCITILQPQASLAVLESTSSIIYNCPTLYRGILGIHAAVSMVPTVKSIQEAGRKVFGDIAKLPHGAVVGFRELLDVEYTQEGKCIYILGSTLPLRVPYVVRGNPGMWDLEIPRNFEEEYL